MSAIRQPKKEEAAAPVSGARPLDLSPAAIRELTSGMELALIEARGALAQKPAKDAGTRDTLMRAFHVIKGYARPLGLLGVQSVAHQLESRLTQSKDAPDLAEFTDALHKIESVLKKYIALQARAGVEKLEIVKSPTFGAFFEQIENLARGLAQELDIKIRIDTVGRSTALPDHWTPALHAAFLHAVRNSLDHGAPPGELLCLHFSAKKLKPAPSQASGQVQLEFWDSGVGIDPVQVRHAAQVRRIPLATPLHLMTDDQVLQLLFTPGFSLSKNVSLLSGRGFGLDIVREAIEFKLGGKVTIESRSGQGTRIIARIPLPFSGS
jgi:chemotaxis protein histidine kinase CheA